MLGVEVYEKIYWSARQMSGRDVVEVGTAHGTATIAAALGLMERYSEGRVYTVDRLEGGSRSVYGGRSENHNIVLENLSHYSVATHVELVVGGAEELPKTLPDDAEVGLLILDADGRIHRDIVNFWSRLPMGATLVIDDYEPIVMVKHSSRRAVQVDAKKLLTYELANELVGANAIRKIEVLDNTLFAEKTSANLPSDIDKRVASAYDRLVFTTGFLPSIKARILTRFLSLSPRLFRLVRRVRNWIVARQS